MILYESDPLVLVMSRFDRKRGGPVAIGWVGETAAMGFPYVHRDRGGDD